MKKILLFLLLTFPSLVMAQSSGIGGGRSNFTDVYSEHWSAYGGAVNTMVQLNRTTTGGPGFQATYFVVYGMTKASSANWVDLYITVYLDGDSTVFDHSPLYWEQNIWEFYSYADSVRINMPSANHQCTIVAYGGGGSAYSKVFSETVPVDVNRMVQLSGNGGPGWQATYIDIVAQYTTLNGDVPANFQITYYHGSDSTVVLRDISQRDVHRIRWRALPVDSVRIQTTGAVPRAACVVKAYGGSGTGFSMIVFPDTQKMTSPRGGGLLAMWEAMGAWTATRASQGDLAAVLHVGDVVHLGNSDRLAYIDAAEEYDKLDVYNIPYIVTPGNHDGVGVGPVVTDTFNVYFGEDRFAGKSWFGGNDGPLPGMRYNNTFIKFEKGGYRFLAVAVQYPMNEDTTGTFWQHTLEWADSVVQAHPDRMAIVVTHHMLNNNGNYAATGVSLFERLRIRPSVFMFICGHFDFHQYHEEDYGGRKIAVAQVNWQEDADGGGGWLQEWKFNPFGQEIVVQSYNPYDTPPTFGTAADSTYYTFPWPLAADATYKY